VPAPVMSRGSSRRRTRAPRPYETATATSLRKPAG